MTPAVRRSGGPVVGKLVALAVLLTAGPPVRLTAQLDGSLLTVLPGSTRSAGLAGAGAALVGGAGAVFANPAGIATIRRLSLEGSYERHLAGSTFSSAALALRVGRFSWGAGAAALDVAGPAADLLGVSSLVYRRGLVALGTSLKYVRQEVGGSSADAWGGDAGLAIAVFDIMALGASVQNIGGDLGGGARLPRRTRVGFTMNYVDPLGTFRLLTTLEGQWLAGHAAVLVAGLEAGLVARGFGGVGLVGRVGATGRSVPGDASAVTVGGGVELGRFHIDYAYRGHDAPDGGHHRFGLRWTP
jgi:hypothetical protein